MVLLCPWQPELLRKETAPQVLSWSCTFSFRYECGCQLKGVWKKKKLNHKAAMAQITAARPAPAHFRTSRRVRSIFRNRQVVQAYRRAKPESEVLQKREGEDMRKGLSFQWDREKCFSLLTSISQVLPGFNLQPAAFNPKINFLQTFYRCAQQRLFLEMARIDSAWQRLALQG